MSYIVRIDCVCVAFGWINNKSPVPKYAPFICLLNIVHSTIRRASLVAWMVKSLPEMKETWVSSLDWEDPLEKGMATHFSILAWRIPWAEEPGGL